MAKQTELFPELPLSKKQTQDKGLNDPGAHPVVLHCGDNLITIGINLDVYDETGKQWHQTEIVKVSAAHRELKITGQIAHPSEELKIQQGKVRIGGKLYSKEFPIPLVCVTDSDVLKVHYSLNLGESK
jgi:hypothetical protein